MVNQQVANIRVNAELLDETRHEDVLKFLLTYKTIGPFKRLIVRALQDKQNTLIAIRDREYEKIANIIKCEIKGL